ncbi:MAG: hypothetical protein D6831_00255 [Aquificota bacterium]|nr:MAG: hypothetical protein D6831_00255 [Aquificota bacterium]
MIYRLLFSLIFVSLLFSCGGGGGGSDSGNTVPNPFPNIKVFSIYAEGCFGTVGFQIECDIPPTIKGQDISIEKGDSIKSWELSSSVINGKLRIVAYNTNLLPMNSNNKILLFKIKAPEGTEISNITEKFVDISGVVIDSANVILEQ